MIIAKHLAQQLLLNPIIYISSSSGVVHFNSPSAFPPGLLTLQVCTPDPQL